MAFDSYYFLFIFLPIVFFLYRIVRTTLLHNVVIVSASLYFYAWGDIRLIPLLLFVSVQDYVVGRLIANSSGERRRFALVTLSVCANLLLLAFFKYSIWLFADLNLILGATPLTWRAPLLDIPLPIGISFYTFHTISYTIDVYRRRTFPRSNLIDYLSFVSFFPLLVAGPIQRAAHLLPQMVRRRPAVSYRNAEFGFFLICWGLTKKMVIADNLGKLVERCQENLQHPGAGTVLALAFCFQIYADFSAYTDIARGCAKLFGISLTKNFLTPYFSASPSEFWRRWHISLSSFLRDYLYVPLGGNRLGTVRTYVNLMITMVLGGVWHGAGVFFLLWGVYHGALLCTYRLFPLDLALVRLLGRGGHVLAVCIMFMFTLFGWVLFFSNPTNFGPIMGSIGRGVLQTPDKLVFQLCWGLLIFVTPLMITDVLGYRRNREFIDLYPRLPSWVRTVIYVLLFYATVFFGRRQGYAFIYFQF